MTKYTRDLVWGNQRIQLSLEVRGNMEKETAEALIRAFDEDISRLRVGMTEVQMVPRG